MRGIRNDTLLGSGDRPQTWPAEQPSSTAKIEQSGFNPHPKFGHGPRRPPPLVKTNDKSGQNSGAGPTFKPFTDPSLTKQEPLDSALEQIGERSTRLVLAPKDVNHKVENIRIKESISSVLARVEDSHQAEPKPRRKKLLADELKDHQNLNRQRARMPSLAEEPEPLLIRKSRVDQNRTETYLQPSVRQQGFKLLPKEGDEDYVQLASDADDDRSKPGGVHRIERGSPDSSHEREGATVAASDVDESSEDIIDSLMAAITEQLSDISVRQRHEFEHHDAVP